MRKLFLGLCVACTLVTAFYLVFFEGYRDVTRGRYFRLVDEFFGDLNDVTEARIYLIQGEGASDGTFPIRPYNQDYPTYGTMELKGDRLNEFLQLWQSQEAITGGVGMCHDPAYGFRLYRNGRMIRETSVCWHCYNFYVPVYPGVSEWAGFNATSDEGKALLDFCDKQLPYKRRE